ncbi:MMPL family transporter [Solihabitans fulvus]|uniref:MMPL family transporter n=1 Tax=Solihabitans fulvus TaxID=1892852 RepID=A0A5B2XFT8_9PSEU|nr:MMPL family transporter [Solihabitans fulvus]KAA2262698.1 MMPL family transporter [Solihabitans fulvus]
MFDTVARLVIRYRWIVLIAAVVFAAVSGAFGAPGVPSLKPGGAEDLSSESSVAAAKLKNDFGHSESDLVLLVGANDHTVDSPGSSAGARAVVDALSATPGVSSVLSYWQTHDSGMRSRDGSQGLVLASIAGDDKQQETVIDALHTDLATVGTGVTVQFGGPAQVGRDLGGQVVKDLGKAEAISGPITLILLVVAFGSVVAGLLPLAIGVLAILGTLLILRGLTMVTDVSTYSLNLATALGLGLAIDYSLFIVGRYREELRAGHTPHDALRVTMRTAGRTVAFSALTVAAALSALLIFPMFFLRSFGYAGIAVVVLAAVGALLVLPALLAVLGTRVDRLSLPWLRRRADRLAARDPLRGRWAGLAAAVLRKPLVTAGLVVGALLLVGIPTLGIKFGLPDDRVLPTTASGRLVAEQVRNNFPTAESATLSVVAEGAAATGAGNAAIADYAKKLATLPHVARVQSAGGSFGPGGAPLESAGTRGGTAEFTSPAGTWLAVVPEGSLDPYSDAGRQLVRDVRATPAPFAVQVAGSSARLVDTEASIGSHLPLAAAIIGLVTLLLLFLFTGSVFIPIKALVLNLLSLGAVFGLIVLVFQQGHLATLLGFTATGTTDTSMPVLLFCITFGLSMDYEVFLLSRIAEEHRRTGDTNAAVVSGIARTGRIITTAAALLAVVFFAFGTAQISFLKLFGLGCAVAILIDATVIRCLLVPAVMGLAGRLNWWAPGPLKRLHRRIGLREDGGAPEPPPPRRAAQPAVAGTEHTNT